MFWISILVRCSRGIATQGIETVLRELGQMANIDDKDAVLSSDTSQNSGICKYLSPCE